MTSGKASRGFRHGASFAGVIAAAPKQAKKGATLHRLPNAVPPAVGGGAAGLVEGAQTSAGQLDLDAVPAKGLSYYSASFAQ